MIYGESDRVFRPLSASTNRSLPSGEREKERIALMQNSSSGRVSSASATRRETTSAPRWLIALSSSGRGRFKSKIIYSIWDRGWAHPAGWQPVIAYITRNDKRRCAATIWKVGHPMGLPFSRPGVIKAFQDIVRVPLAFVLPENLFAQVPTNVPPPSCLWATGERT